MSYTPIAGDYFVVSTKGLVGFFIQLGTFSKMNHTGIYIGNGRIIEATTRLGVIESDLSKYDGLPLVWNHQDNPTDAQRAIIIETAKKQLGKKYFFGDIAVIAARILNIPVPKIILRHLATSKREICSAMTALCMRAAGFTIEPGKPVYFVTPSDLTYRLLWI